MTGFEVVDLDDHFFAVQGAKRPYFESQADGHWNGRAHGIVADALMRTEVFLHWRAARRSSRIGSLPERPKRRREAGARRAGVSSRRRRSAHLALWAGHAVYYD